MTRNPADERFAHRLEAFSDIVLAFSLGQLALNSAIPSHARDVITHPVTFVAYAVTFGIVVSVWTIHHRLFAEYFSPARAFVALNFVMLGFVVYLSYAMQVYVRFSEATLQADASFATALYFTTLGIVFGLLGVLYVLGVAAQEPAAGVSLNRGKARAARLLSLGLPLAAGVPITYAMGLPVESAGAGLLVGGVLLGRAIGRRFPI